MNASEIDESLKKQFVEGMLSNISIYKWNEESKGNRERTEMKPNSSRQKMSDRIDTIIENKFKIGVVALSDINLNAHNIKRTLM